MDSLPFISNHEGRLTLGYDNFGVRRLNSKAGEYLKTAPLSYWGRLCLKITTLFRKLLGQPQCIYVYAHRERKSEGRPLVDTELLLIDLKKIQGQIKAIIGTVRMIADPIAHNHGIAPFKVPPLPNFSTIDSAKGASEAIQYLHDRCKNALSNCSRLEKALEEKSVFDRYERLLQKRGKLEVQASPAPSTASQSPRMHSPT